MDTIIGIDPGVSGRNATGWAVVVRTPAGWRVGRLGVLRPLHGGKPGDMRGLPLIISDLIDQIRTLDLPQPDCLVVERPQIYNSKVAKGDPNDCIPLAVLVGAILAEAPSVRALLPLPHDWTGNVPFEVRLERMLRKGALTTDMLATIQPGGLRHNAVDAAGLAFYGAAELDRGVATAIGA